jgi:O-antigen ligase
MRISRIGLYIALFPTFGLDKFDSTGLDRPDAFSPSFVLQGAWTALCALLLLGVWRTSRDARGSAGRQLERILFMCAMAIGISIAMSTPTDLFTWLRAAQYMVIAALAVLSVATASQRFGLVQVAGEIRTAVRVWFSLILVILAAFLMVNPEMALVSPTERAARFGGYVIHPNTLALGASLVFLSAIHEVATIPGAKMRGLLWMCISVSVVIATGSVGGAMCVFVACLLAVAAKNNKLAVLATICASMASVCIVLFLAAGIDIESLPATWRDRTILYSSAIEGIARNPFFGVGSFKGVKSYFEQHLLLGYFIPPDAHNILLDLALSKGVVGAVPFLYILGSGLRFFVRRLVRGFPPELFFPAGAFALIFVHGLVEPSISGTVKPFSHAIFFAGFAFLFLLKREGDSRRSRNLGSSYPSSSMNSGSPGTNSA